jgi:hypothetical protein
MAARITTRLGQEMTIIPVVWPSQGEAEVQGTPGCRGRESFINLGSEGLTVGAIRPAAGAITAVLRV